MSKTYYKQNIEQCKKNGIQLPKEEVVGYLLDLISIKNEFFKKIKNSNITKREYIELVDFFNETNIEIDISYLKEYLIKNF